MHSHLYNSNSAYLGTECVLECRWIGRKLYHFPPFFPFVFISYDDDWVKRKEATYWYQANFLIKYQKRSMDHAIDCIMFWLLSKGPTSQHRHQRTEVVIFWQLGTKLVGSVLPRYLIGFLINFPPVSDDIKAQFIAQATRWVLERYKKTRHPIFYYYSINSALRNSTRGIRPPAVF